MTDNRTTELLRKLLDERGLSCQTHYLHVSWRVGSKLYDAVDNLDGTLTVDNLTPEQAVAATLGRPKAKAHPYGYEPDTGAFDCTRCECGCINDISATYCNDCGGEIEIDKNGNSLYQGYEEIVRCRDCVAYEPYHTYAGMKLDYGECTQHRRQTNDDRFCWWAERSDR